MIELVILLVYTLVCQLEILLVHPFEEEGLKGGHTQRVREKGKKDAAMNKNAHHMYSQDTRRHLLLEPKLLANQ